MRQAGGMQAEEARDGRATRRADQRAIRRAGHRAGRRATLDGPRRPMETAAGRSVGGQRHRGPVRPRGESGTKVIPTRGALLFVVLSLCGVGLVMVLSASAWTSLTQDGSVWTIFERQALWMGIGADSVRSDVHDSATSTGANCDFHSEPSRTSCVCSCFSRVSDWTRAARAVGSGWASCGCSRPS